MSDRSYRNPAKSWLEAVGRCESKLHLSHKLLEKADQFSNEDEVRKALTEAVLTLRASIEPLYSFLGRTGERAMQLRELVGNAVMHWEFIKAVREQEFHDGAAINRQHVNIIFEGELPKADPNVWLEDNGEDYATRVERFSDGTLVRTRGPKIQRAHRLHLTEGEGYGAGLSAADFKESLRGLREILKLIPTVDSIQTVLTTSAPPPTALEIQTEYDRRTPQHTLVIINDLLRREGPKMLAHQRKHGRCLTVIREKYSDQFEVQFFTAAELETFSTDREVNLPLEDAKKDVSEIAPDSQLAVAVVEFGGRAMLMRFTPPQIADV